MSDGSTGANPGQHYEQTHLPRRRSTLDPPIMPQPNKSSCGNQPANISLTMPVENDSPTPLAPSRSAQNERPAETNPEGRSFLPIDSENYISVLRACFRAWCGGLPREPWIGAASPAASGLMSPFSRFLNHFPRPSRGTWHHQPVALLDQIRGVDDGHRARASRGNGYLQT
jgi:hypothetical protein